MNNKNKGFTLVELIIVVAIIAVLAAVLAPQYLQYVERSRQSNDLQIATHILKAATISISDPKNNVPPDTEIFVVWETDDFDTGIAGRLYVDTTFNLETAGNLENDPDHEFERNLIESMGGIMSSVTGTGDDDAWGEGRLYYDLGDPLSSAAKEDDFKFSINSSTGNISFYKDKFKNEPLKDGEEYVWIDVIGVNP